MEFDYIENERQRAKESAYRDAAGVLELEAGQSVTSKHDAQLLRRMAARIIGLSGSGTWGILMSEQLERNVIPLVKGK